LSQAFSFFFVIAVACPTVVVFMLVAAFLIRPSVISATILGMAIVAGILIASHFVIKWAAYRRDQRAGS
jgi:hypothetical protein